MLASIQTAGGTRAGSCVSGPHRPGPDSRSGLSEDPKLKAGSACGWAPVCSLPGPLFLHTNVSASSAAQNLAPCIAAQRPWTPLPPWLLLGYTSSLCKPSP